jgi:light-regulated signal transduction histidine kinase (bacteriophytochrome)
LHAGEITVETKSAAGACFCFSLPTGNAVGQFAA